MTFRDVRCWIDDGAGRGLACLRLVPYRNRRVALIVVLCVLPFGGCLICGPTCLTYFGGYK